MGKKYNKGEWSEFYVFLKILAEGKLYAADENLEKIPEIYYSILAVIKNGIKYNRDQINNDIVFIYDNEQFRIPIEEFIALENTVIKEIQNNSGTFKIADAEKFLPKIKSTTIKEKSATKGDILLQVHDDYTGFEPTLSFSIKSYLGSNPTLLNASSGTVVHYKLIGELSKNDILEINQIEGGSKVSKRIEALSKMQIKLKYKNFESEVFTHNLKMIDSRLEEIIADIYLESYTVVGKKVSDVVNTFLIKNPSENQDIIEYKVKEFLVAIALGMVPKTKWNGLDEANGGYIVVKDNAEVLCYHIYDRNRLKQYLYNNTKFDTPSTSRYSNYNAGLISVNEDKSLEFTLVMQIRF